ncbi:MAG: hypothetical protein OXF24_05540 [Hyphomicrobiales bacterium]|nr:hypothetical protein [Hyphomicrobiales bacterium]MCY4052244.1 hypothetical protein [Hyphomicrobiales bacterium]
MKLSEFERAFEYNIERRRKFSLPGYKNLAEVCNGDFDGEYVTPLQIEARSATGICLVSHYWFNVEGLEKCNPDSERYRLLKEHGYTPSIDFNRIVNAALEKVGLCRADTYMTQVFHLLPLKGRPNKEDIWPSFEAITQFEIRGRRVIALGGCAKRICERARREFGTDFFESFESIYSPSYRYQKGKDEDERATEIAATIRKIL